MFGSSSPLLKQGVEVSAKGDLVTLRIGNVDIPMPYEHALDLSRWIRLEARFAKAGTSRARTVRSLGILEDLRTKPLPYTPGVAIHVKEKLQTWHREDVEAIGRLVKIKIGPHTIQLHFESALRIAQWLRVRAKEAQRTVGDSRHWSTLKGESDA